MSVIALAAAFALSLPTGSLIDAAGIQDMPGSQPPVAPAIATQVSRVLERFDTDRDGRISRAEWTAAGRPEGGFTRFDADRDGYLVSSELTTAIQSLSQARSNQTS